MDEADRQRADELARDEDAEEVATEQVGVGSAPGRPPAVGTGQRRHLTDAPPTGRFDDERATWGASEDIPGSAAEGAPLLNVGGTQADTPRNSVADFPGRDEAEEPGASEPGARGHPDESSRP
ncbi:MAG: hypothetical protein M3N29_10030 [Chloroflexota bacterium]|nr:hypothetical protein [Chloroflexota bacterium]